MPGARNIRIPSRIPSNVVVAAGGGTACAFALALSLFALTTCKTAPPPAAGAAQGATCGTDLDCNDGLVCSCGQCLPPGPENLPPACNAGAVGCPKPFPTACVSSCAGPFLGNADCNEGGVETCSTGILFSTCGSDAGCLPDAGEETDGFVCVGGSLSCIEPSAADAGCVTADCNPADTFLCVTSCADVTNAFAAKCVNHLFKCDVPQSFPETHCADAGPADGGPADAGPADGGPCADELPKPLCLEACNPADPLNAARCAPTDGGARAFDWSCAGFLGPHGLPYVPATDCPADAGPADAGPGDAGPADAGPADAG